MVDIPMDLKTAKAIIAEHAQRKPSEITEAVDVLYQKFGTYQAITREIGKSDKYWIMRHRISQLPSGIRWKIDEGHIGIGQGYQIARLTREEDQWLLAIVIIEARCLTTKECGKVVNLVLKEEKSIIESLSILMDIHFDEIQPLSLPLRSDIWISICKIAWTRHQKWEDICYQLVRQGVDVDFQELASQLEKLASDLRNAGKDLLSRAKLNQQSPQHPATLILKNKHTQP